tara:strand:+ start:9667 stop:10818 length:1152 start_codon:yes stop_codon:yes gene_type:complete
MPISFEDFHKQQKESKIRQKMLAKKSGGGKKFGGGAGGGFEPRKPPAWKFRMRDYKFRPDENETRVRIIPTEENQTFYKYYAKWVTTPQGQKRQIISNAWNTERALPCVLYYYCAEEEKEDFWADEKCAVSVFVMEDFYKIPHTSEKGYEYFTYERVPAPDRNGRISHPSSAHEGYEIVFGRKLWWELWPGQKRQLLEKLAEIGNKCANCEKGEISTYAYACPECEFVMANHQEEEIDPSDEEVLRTSPVECSSCGYIGMATPVVECVHPKGHGSRKTYEEGCGNPIQLDWKDCDIVLRADQVGGRVSYQIAGFEAADTVATSDVPQEDLEPFDFNYFLGMQSLDDQARAMGRHNPFDGSAQSILDNHYEAGHDEEDSDSVPF